MAEQVSGFSKMSKRQKIRWLVEGFFKDPDSVAHELMEWWHPSADQQKVLDGFTENAISNYPLPFSVAPNFVINGKLYAVPMVIEESSVVAAAASAAKFWADRGGFKTKIIDTKKLGQVHFKWTGPSATLFGLFAALEDQLMHDSEAITANMRLRGGGIVDIKLLDKTQDEPNYYQILASFDTKDSMGANFINTVLEQFAITLNRFLAEQTQLPASEQQADIIMCILSNYTPDCLVRAWVECPVDQFDEITPGMSGAAFAEKFATAVRIAYIDPYRATTHNKGIYNGIDSVVLATGNDFRAIEACGHTYAARSGQYRSLSTCTVEKGIFRFELNVPMAVGTVGGLTKLHPLARRSMEMLGSPSASELMQVIASVGLAQNFGAVRSLVTTGIQKGHMKMHLTNIMNQLGANAKEIAAAEVHFEQETVSHAGVRAFLERFRAQK
jgi:hydroxymethylglutaryl-CoA reductase